MSRVLVLTNWYPPHHLGGYELSCFDVMTRLEERGHEVHVLCGDTRLGDDRAATHPDHETRVRRTLRLYHDGTDILRPSWPERYRLERHNHRELARALEEVRPDVVSVWHLAGMSHGLLAPLVGSRVPLVFGIYDDWLTFGLKLDAWSGAFDRTTLRRRLAPVAERILRVPCRAPDIGDAGSYLFVSAATERYAVETARCTPQRRAVVWGGIDGTLFTPPPAGRGPWRWRLVATGRFDPRKGFETAVRALALLPEEATLALWGRGGDEERARLAGIAAELGVADRVSFGSLEREELPDRYREADAMIFPSIWPEPLGLVPLEAMACGTPVVGTGVGGSCEYLYDGATCLRFPAEDHVALAAALRRLADDPDLRQRVSEGGLAMAAALDIERLTDDMEAWHVWEAGGRAGDPPPQRRLPVPVERPA